MSRTKVRGYKDSELLNFAESLPSFKYVPDNYWIYGVMSKENTPDVFDDKFYLFKKRKFIMVLPGTANSGLYGLKNFFKWEKRGVAQVKPNEWYYDVWKRGLHNGKVEALRQVGPFKVIRDNNGNDVAGDVLEWSWESNRGLNFHPNTYNLRTKVLRWIIGKWSVGCAVVNDIPKYVKLMSITQPQNLFTYCLVEEF